MTEIDLRDPQVREMVQRNHLPEEHWSGELGGSQLVSVNCQTCYQDWPCVTVRELRQVLPRSTWRGKPAFLYPEEYPE